MCLAIAKPVGKFVSVEHLQNGFDNNRDGAGFAFADNGRMIIRKGFFTFGEFMDAYKTVDDRQAIVHFRKASSGPINRKNCHPWVVSPDICMIHNGILGCPSTRRTSDTGWFVKKRLQPMAHRICDPAFKSRVERFIGSYNKFVFLSSSGEISIYNEKSGHWNDGVWYSNYSYSGAIK